MTSPQTPGSVPEPSPQTGLDIAGLAERWQSRYGVTDKDRAEIDAAVRACERVIELLRPILSMEVYSLLTMAIDGPDSHQLCDDHQTALIQAVARHFGPLEPAILAVAQHVEEHHDGRPEQTCGLPFTVADLIPDPPPIVA